MNLTELARKLKIPTKELKAKLPELGFHIGLRAIQIPDKQAEKVIVKWREMKKLEELQKRVEQAKKVEEKKEEKISEKKGVVAIPEVITVNRLAEKLNLPVTKIISELTKNGVMATINENLDFEIAAIIAESLGFRAEKTQIKEARGSQIKEKIKELISRDKKTQLVPRPPVVVVLGHVDHGKTTLLDYLRQTNIAAQEAGAITQHIGAYQIKVKGKGKKEHKLTFIDTPGHEAFNEMRVRGGQVADIAILIIAADDKIQPQTLESIKVIQEADLPFVVAINKIDKPEADIDKIKKGLSEINLAPEDWGGQVICVPISAKNGQGVDNLLEMVLLIAEMEKDKLVANPSRPAVGVVIESHLDKSEGPIASVLVHSGTLSVKDNLVVGNVYGRVRAMKDWQGQFIEKALPGMPVQILGIKAVPIVGDVLEVVVNPKEFKQRTKKLNLSYKKLAVDRQSVTISQGEEKSKEAVVFNVILRADVSGSLEAVINALKKLENEEIKVKIIKKGLGNITDSDLDLAKNLPVWLVGFNVGVSPTAESLAKESEVKIYLFKIIYKLIEEIKKQINALIKPEIIEHSMGKLKVLAIFRKSGNEMIIGAKVIEGEIKKGTKICVWRGDKVLAEGDLVQLQINKQNVESAKSGAECGIRFAGQPVIVIDDILEIFSVEKVERKIFD